LYNNTPSAHETHGQRASETPARADDVLRCCQWQHANQKIASTHYTLVFIDFALMGRARESTRLNARAQATPAAGAPPAPGWTPAKCAAARRQMAERPNARGAKVKRGVGVGVEASRAAQWNCFFEWTGALAACAFALICRQQF
jgi:hypothetical protein